MGGWAGWAERPKKWGGVLAEITAPFGSLFLLVPITAIQEVFNLLLRHHIDNNADYITKKHKAKIFCVHKAKTQCIVNKRKSPSIRMVRSGHAFSARQTDIR